MYAFETLNLEKNVINMFLAWRGRVCLWLSHHFLKTNCSSTRSMCMGTQLWRRAGSFRSEFAQSPSTWEVDAFIECLLLWDELWTNAQNSHWHQQAERKHKQSPAVQFSCEPTMESQLFRAKTENQSQTPAHAKDSCVVDSQAGYPTIPKLVSKNSIS